MSDKEQVTNEIFDFFIKSTDFNGIPLSDLAKRISIEYHKFLPIIKLLVLDETISIQSGENPHIIRFGHYDKEMQLKYLEEAENNEIKIIDTIAAFDNKTEPIIITSESHLLCAYPSRSYLKEKLITKEFDTTPFTKRLAYGEAQITPVFFEIDVLERYFIDPRYHFEFDDYSGHISINENEHVLSDLKEHDQIFLKTFGLGYDELQNRVVTVYLRYLSSLSHEHQMYWNTKIKTTPCKMVKEYYENTVLGKWVFSQSTFSAFIEEQKIISDLSKLITGKPLFRETFEGDKRPKEFTFFTNPTLSNYELFISLLDKMISDNINKDFFNGKIEEFYFTTLSEGIVERKSKGTLTMLDEWLRKFYKLKNEDGYKVLLEPFKEVRKERQKPAHKISENYYDKAFFTKQMTLLDKVYDSFNGLRHIFQQHPKTLGYKIPDWIENGDIKNF